MAVYAMVNGNVDWFTGLSGIRPARRLRSLPYSIRSRESARTRFQILSAGIPGWRAFERAPAICFLVNLCPLNVVGDYAPAELRLSCRHRWHLSSQIS